MKICRRMTGDDCPMCYLYGSGRCHFDPHTGDMIVLDEGEKLPDGRDEE